MTGALDGEMVLHDLCRQSHRRCLVSASHHTTTFVLSESASKDCRTTVTSPQTHCRPTLSTTPCAGANAGPDGL